MGEISNESLLDATRDINQVLGLKPQIGLDWELDRIHSSLQSVSELVEATDDLQEETWQVLITLGFLKPVVVQGVKERFPESSIISEVPMPVVEVAETPVTIATPVVAATPAEPVAVAAPAEPATAVKKDKPAKPAKPAVAKPGSTRGKRDYAALVEKLIEQGDHTQKDIVNEVLRAYPAVKADSVRTFVSDSKNPKYTTFSRTVVVAADEKVRFAD
jgi:hypothetical protein